ncbi:MAG: VWA domain-containing protein [Cytophagaceae bacterium]|nr:VWA domain-containing protein [Cytophagaceae bacterium]
MNNFEYDINQWWSLYWFHPDTLSSMEWEHSEWLYVIPLLVLTPIFRWLFLFKFRQKYAVAFFTNEVKGYNILRLVRHLPFLVFLISLSLILISLSRPTKAYEKNTTYTNGVHIVFALDISESMLLEDIQPNRLKKAKSIIRQAVKNRTHDRLSLVGFAGDAITIIPLTNDTSLFQQELSRLHYTTQLPSGTALGTAIGVGINRLKTIKEGEKIIILISDGENTTGILDPETAAEMCLQYGIKLYTIAIGSDGTFELRDKNSIQYIETHVDIELLKKMAEKTGGKNISSTIAVAELKKIFTDAEKGRIVDFYYTNKKDYYIVYLKWSIVFFIFWLFFKITWINNYLED